MLVLGLRLTAVGRTRPISRAASQITCRGSEDIVASRHTSVVRFVPYLLRDSAPLFLKTTTRPKFAITAVSLGSRRAAPCTYPFGAGAVSGRLRWERDEREPCTTCWRGAKGPPRSLTLPCTRRSPAPPTVFGRAFSGLARSGCAQPFAAAFHFTAPSRGPRCHRRSAPSLAAVHIKSPQNERRRRGAGCGGTRAPP